MPDRSVDVPVIIAGGGLVGLFGALFLARHGVPPLLVERRAGPLASSRPALVRHRTMEIVRTLGLEEAIRTKSYDQFEPGAAVVSAESIAAVGLGHATPRPDAGFADLSPVEPLLVTQDALEAILRQRAEQYGAELRAGTELVSVRQDDEGINGVIRDTGSGKSADVRARYLIAADGGRSGLREQLGIRMDGRGRLASGLSMHFRASIVPLLRGRTAGIVVIRSSRLRGCVCIEKPYESGWLVVHAIGTPEAPVEDSWQLDEDRRRELVRAALGADAGVEIDAVDRWECAALVANAYREQRVFLAGDAAHVMPPQGGFGGSCGIQDAQNLAWKLALVLRGTASPALLDTYEAERRPIGALTVEQAYLRFVQEAAAHRAVNGVPTHVPDPALDLGWCYHSAAVVNDPAGRDRPLHGDPRTSRGSPGTRAPHVALAQSGTPLSTIDLFGREFVLLTGPDGNAWPAAAADVGADLDVRIEVCQVGGAELADPQNRFAEAYGIATDGAALVRPDGVVGWRALNAQMTCAGALRQGMSAILGRG